MALDLRKVAQRATTLSEIMVGREKGETEELIERKSNVHIDNCEFVTYTKNGKEEQVWVFTVKEEPKKFYFGGTIVKNIFTELLKECQGDYEELYESIKAFNLEVKFEDGKTADGKAVTLVTVY